MSEEERLEELRCKILAIYFVLSKRKQKEANELYKLLLKLKGLT